jgi:hypothetical protein
MFRFAGKLLGQIIPGVMATIIGAYLVQQIFPGKNAEAPAPGPTQPTAAVMSPTPMAPASKLAKGLSGPPAEPTEITGPNKSVKEPVKEAAAPTAAPATPAPATTGTIMPRRVGPPGPVPVVARERVAEPQPVRAETRPPVPPAREEPAVPPLELAAKVIASLPPGKTSPAPRDLPETRDGARDGAWAPPPPNVPPPAQTVSVAPLPPPPGAAPAAAAPMPIVPPSAATVPPLAPPQETRVPLAPPPDARAPLTRDPVQLSDAERENLARIPLPLPDGVEPPRRPSLFERGGALVKGVVSSVRSVLPGQH